jgi:hypothetical protein
MQYAVFVLFCASLVADAQTLAAHVGTCFNLKTQAAKKIGDDARIWAGKIFAQKFGADIIWGDCSDQDFPYDRQILMWEFPSMSAKPVGNLLLSNDHGMSVPIVNYAFANWLASKGKFTPAKIVGATILASVVQHFSGIASFDWNQYDLQFIEADDPQGYTNEVVAVVRRALMARTAPHQPVSLSIQLPASARP